MVVCSDVDAGSYELITFSLTDASGVEALQMANVDRASDQLSFWDATASPSLIVTNNKLFPRTNFINNLNNETIQQNNKTSSITGTELLTPY